GALAAPRRLETEGTSGRRCGGTADRRCSRASDRGRCIFRALMPRRRRRRRWRRTRRTRSAARSRTCYNPPLMSRLTFQDLILNLQNFWAGRGGMTEPPLDLEAGAATMHPATFLRVPGPEPFNVGYVHPSRRFVDGRYGDNPFRLGKHYQFQ